MSEAKWLTGTDPIALVGLLPHSAFSERKARLYAVACCRLLERQTPDWPAAAVIPLLERLAESGDTSSVLTSVDSGWGPHEYKTWTGPPPWSRENAVLRAAVGPMPGPTAEPATSPDTQERLVTINHLLGLYGIVTNMKWALRGEQADSAAILTALLREIFSNPFRPNTFFSEWRTDTVTALAQQMYESREYGAMPILADALQDAGCDNDDILSHCRGTGPHVRGCWVVDLILCKE